MKAAFFYWSGDKPPETLVSEYEPTAGSRDGGWLSSPFSTCCRAGDDEMRRRLHLRRNADFRSSKSCAHGGPDRLARHGAAFRQEAAIGEMDCFMSRWTTAPRRLCRSDCGAAPARPGAGLAIKSVSLARVAQSLVEAYLGRDAGRRVLQRRMVSRGAVERINAVALVSECGLHVAVGAHRIRRAHSAAQRLCRGRHHVGACGRAATC